jgi:hypothetical protein
VNYKEAINASQIWAARGYDQTKVCVVSVCFYGGKLMWLEGWKGNWSKTWEAVPEEKLSKLDDLNFFPTGPKPEEQIAAELLDMLGVAGVKPTSTISDAEMQKALAEIADEYDYEKEVGDDYFNPMGETYDMGGALD